MNIKKVKSGNIEQAYENLIRNNANNDYNKTLHNRKSPLYKNNLRNNFLHLIDLYRLHKLINEIIMIKIILGQGK